MVQEKLWFKVWPEGTPKTLQPYPEKPLHKFLDEHASSKPDRPLVIYEDGRVFTYGKVSEESSKIAAAIWDMGVRKGDPVAVMMFNRPEFISCFYGGLKAGAKVAIIDALTISEDLKMHFEMTKPKVIFTDAEVWEREKKIFEEYGYGLKNTIVVEGGEDTLSYGSVLAKYEAKPPNVQINPREDVAIIAHYAGIVGRTLEVYHTHYGIVAAMISASAFYGRREGVTSLVAIPLSHLFGVMEIAGPVIAGGTIVLMKRFDLDRALELIKKYNVNLWPGPPMMFDAVLKKGLKKEDVPSLMLCVTGAAPVPPDLQKAFFEDVGIPLIQGYGLTEGLVVTAQPPNVRVYGSVGIPLPDVDVKIVDKETGTKELPPGEVGELIVKSPWIMRGYKDPEETKKAIRDGWLYTGDLLMMDENGLLYFRGLKKRFLKYKAYPIFPRDLEIILLQHPAVKDTYVDGEWDPEVGHKPFAKVVLKDEYKGKVSAEELINFVNERVAFYKKLRKVEFVDKI